MIITTRIFENRKVRKELKRAPKSVIKAYEIWASLVELHGTKIMKDFPGYQDEKLIGEWKGFRSSRLNKQWRVIYSSNMKDKVEVVSVERVTPHDYRRKT